MKKINLAAVPVQESRSPKGRFRYYSQDVLTAIRQTNGDRLTGVRLPFEVKLVSLPPRAAERALSLALRPLGLLSDHHRSWRRAHASGQIRRARRAIASCIRRARRINC
jgi:hypothetical protein